MAAAFDGGCVMIFFITMIGLKKITQASAAPHQPLITG